MRIYKGMHQFNFMDKSLPIYKLEISEDLNSEQEVNAVALVDIPAIGEGFFAFKMEPSEGETQDDYLKRCIPEMINEGKDQEQAAAICYSKWENRGMAFQDSYSDYPKAASENAKTALRWAEENGWGDCGTAVGKARANQLAKGEPISRDTIARMAAFERHRQNSQRELGDGCGRLMWLAWGGDAGIEWAQRKLNQIDMRFSIINEEERIVVGPAMIPNKLIYRNEKDSAGNIISEYNVMFDAKTIQTIAQKFFAKNFQNNGNEMHDPEKVVDMVYFQSWIADESKGIPKMKQFESLPDGTWFLGAKINSDEAWQKVKDGTFRGFSVEGYFNMVQIKMSTTPENILEQIKQLLKSV